MIPLSCGRFSHGYQFSRREDPTESTEPPATTPIPVRSVSEALAVAGGDVLKLLEALFGQNVTDLVEESPEMLGNPANQVSPQGVRDIEVKAAPRKPQVNLPTSTVRVVRGNDGKLVIE